jgi:4-aminobutyrate aminotransferase-like enzyme
MLNAFAEGNHLPAETVALIERRKALLGKSYRLFYAEPIHIVRGEGAWLFDASGRRYLDAYNNVASVGHCHPRVVEAIRRQVAILNTHTRYLDENILDYCERLATTLPPGLGRMVFTCSGSEANDLALRIARYNTGASGVIVTRFAYHGVTEATARISPSLGAESVGADNVRLVQAPDTYRLGESAGAAFAEDVRTAVASLKADGHGVAAMICDTIFSSDGVFVRRDLLSEAARVVQEAGGLFVADEVQAGFYRTGQFMWGAQRHGVVPDILTMGKPMGNGHPIAALALRAELADRFGEHVRYFNTFGGNTVSIAAARATLDAIIDEGLGANAATVGDWLGEEILRLACEQDVIGDVRQAGLFLGVELVGNQDRRTPAAALAQAVVNQMRRLGVLISLTGTYGNVLKIRPPLIWGREHVDLFVATLAQSLSEARREIHDA